MSSRLPIATLTGLARTRTDEAVRKLAALRNASLGADRKLEMLLEYRRDYGEQLRTLMAAGLPSAQLRNYQEFLRALDTGIEQQRAAVAQAGVRLDRGRAEWQQQQRRLSAYETLAERLQAQQQLVQARRDQRASDEQAARLSLARAATLPSA